MENNLDDASYIRSSYLNREQLEKQLNRVKEAADTSQRRMDYAVAHDERIQRAIETVEAFLKKKHRLCYGGQAINAHLPERYQFYDRDYSIPDYDFFTPSQPADIQFLVKELRSAGFQEISAREGMHEGTVKIYVDYVPVADITVMDPKLYKILSSREYRKDGISYVDANTLRMMMYLELSRPKGEVTRWPKVYERLALFNEFVSQRACSLPSSMQLLHGELSGEQAYHTLQFMIDNKRVFAGGDLLTFYRQTWTKKKSTPHLEWIFRTKKPILFYSPTPEEDAEQLAAEFRLLDMKAQLHPTAKSRSSKKKKEIRIKTQSSKGVEILPSFTVIERGTVPLVLIIHQTACHAYVTVPLHDETRRALRIASMDTLITLYFSLGLVHSSYFEMGSMECVANQLVELSMKTRKHADQFRFPFLSITCAGHQTSMSSLIRSKVERMMRKRTQLRSVMRLQNQTVSNPKKTTRRTTVKRVSRRA